jgi:hypothetical protein
VAEFSGSFVSDIYVMTSPAVGQIAQFVHPILAIALLIVTAGM